MNTSFQQPTFDCCPDWLREIEEYASPKVLKVLVGNKTDRDDREIPAEVGDEFAQRHGMYYLETSAKACDNVDRLFAEIAHELLQVSDSPHLLLSDALDIYKVTLHWLFAWDIQGRDAFVVYFWTHFLAER